jgi:hypothetical protein
VEIQRKMCKIEYAVFGFAVVLLFFASYFFDLSLTGRTCFDISKIRGRTKAFGQGVSGRISETLFCAKAKELPTFTAGPPCSSFRQVFLFNFSYLFSSSHS